MLYVATAALVAFASAVEAKGGSKKPKVSSGGSGDNCYDDQGNEVPCPISTTWWIVIGIVGGIILLSLILCCVFRKKIKGLVSKNKDKKGAHKAVPSGEASLPLYHNNEASAYDPDQKHGSGIPASEKAQYGYSTPYDPAYPPSQHGHQHSASTASSLYNVPAVTPAPPHDYSYQHQQYNNTSTTALPGTYAPPPAPPHY